MLSRIYTSLFLTSLLPLSAEIGEDITLGVETLTGLRSSYNYRGFQLADSTLEAQIESEVALSNGYSIPIAAWTIAEQGGDFAETSLSIGLQKGFEEIQLTTFLDYHSFEGGLFESGFDIGLEAQWFISSDWSLRSEARYDWGAAGAYFALEGGYSKPLGEDLFLSAESGLSVVSDYYERDGVNDFYGRLSLTYNVNSFLAVSPFVGFSQGLADSADGEAYAGVWLAVSF